VVVLWATNSALQSREVAFEIGAASAYERAIIPCCVHIPPNTLPWGLAERQALVMDRQTGWDKLANRVAEMINFGGPLELAPLLELAGRFLAPSHALDLIMLGYTLELKNVSSSPVYDITITSPDPSHAPPEWHDALERKKLDPNQSVILFRDSTETASDVVIEWSDVAETRQRRVVTVEPTDTSVA
jgi:hypothetical protein